MRGSVTILLTGWLLFGLGSARAQSPGFIHVKCKPGVLIFLDGNFKGRSTENLLGFVIEEVPPGPHVVRAVLRGHVPQEVPVRVTSGEIALLELKPFVPEPKGEGKTPGPGKGEEPPSQPPPYDGEPLYRRIEKAIEKGVAYLKGKQRKNGCFGAVPPGRAGYNLDGKNERETHHAGICGLSLYALLKSGVDPKDPVIAKGFDFFDEGLRKGVYKPMWLSSYELSFMILALEAKYNPHKRESVRAAVEGAKAARRKVPVKRESVVLRPRDCKILQEWVDALVYRRSPHAWRYNIDPPNINRQLKFNQDMSSTQLAMLALLAASHCARIRLDKRIFYPVIDFCLKNQEADGPVHPFCGGPLPSDSPVRSRGFAYNVESPRREEKHASGSMTTAGCTSLLIAKALLQKYPKYMRIYEKKVDQAVSDGMAWLAKNWSMKENPKRPHYYFYLYLYGLERVGDLQNTLLIGTHLWYNEGAVVLVEEQDASGSWLRGDTCEPSDVINTCFALLFLDRATRPLVVTPRKK
jgi:hypothetical protein